MHTPSPPPRHPVLLKVLSVTVALGFLGTVMCTAGGRGSEAPRSMATPSAERDGGTPDAGRAPADTANSEAPESPRYFPATKAGPLDLGERASPPQREPPQQAPRQQTPQQAEPR